MTQNPLPQTGGAFVRTENGELEKVQAPAPKKGTKRASKPAEKEA